MKRQVVEPPRSTAGGYMTDGMGHVRIMQLTRQTVDGYASNTDVYMAKPTPDGPWRPFSTVYNLPTGLSQGFIPVAVDPQANFAYGFDSKNGFTAVFKKPLDGTGEVTEVASNPTADIDDLITIGRRDRVVGVSFATQRRTEVYFDQGLSNLRTALGNALPNSRSSASRMPARMRTSCFCTPEAIRIRAASTSSTSRPTSFLPSCRRAPSSPESRWGR